MFIVYYYDYSLHSVHGCCIDTTKYKLHEKEIPPPKLYLDINFRDEDKRIKVYLLNMNFLW